MHSKIINREYGIIISVGDREKNNIMYNYFCAVPIGGKDFGDYKFLLREINTENEDWRKSYYLAMEDCNIKLQKKEDFNDVLEILVNDGYKVFENFFEFRRSSKMTPGVWSALCGHIGLIEYKTPAQIEREITSQVREELHEVVKCLDNYKVFWDVDILLGNSFSENSKQIGISIYIPPKEANPQLLRSLKFIKQSDGYYVKKFYGITKKDEKEIIRNRRNAN